MSGLIFQDVSALILLWAVPILCAIYWFGFRRRAEVIRRFANVALLESLLEDLRPNARRTKAVLVCVAVFFIVVALARPAWNPSPELIRREGRDVVFVLDVSRSMLAEDLAPNRLERAKLAINDAVEKLQGDRVGLVVFAGTAVVKCPLTLDYGFFRFALQEVSTLSVNRGGTMIGDALRKATNEVFDKRSRQYKDIVLITDGEDHESFPVEAAEGAGAAGIRLITLGIGNENEGQRIPLTSRSGEKKFLTHNGQEVWSKLDGDTLRKMVNATPDGKYFNVGTGTIDLGDVYSKLIAGASRREIEARTMMRYEEKFQIFLMFAFILLCVELLIRERRCVN